jgi:hypothetical protein
METCQNGRHRLCVSFSHWWWLLQGDEERWISMLFDGWSNNLRRFW